MYASNEKKAHDLAVAIVAQKCINSDPSEIAHEYDDYYQALLKSFNNMDLEYLVELGIIHP